MNINANRLLREKRLRKRKQKLISKNKLKQNILDPAWRDCWTVIFNVPNITEREIVQLSYVCKSFNSILHEICIKIYDIRILYYIFNYDIKCKASLSVNFINKIQNSDRIFFRTVLTNKSVPITGDLNIRCRYCGTYFHFNDVKSIFSVPCVYCSKDNIYKTVNKYNLFIEDDIY